MKAENIVAQLKNNNKGQHLPISWTRTARLRKGLDCVVEKHTTAWVRAGISYSNLASVKDEVSQGIKDSSNSLPWGKWREGFQDYIIDHVDKMGAKKEYVRLYPSSFRNLTSQVCWKRDGQTVEFSDVKDLLQDSEKRREHARCFTILADNVQWVGEK